VKYPKPFAFEKAIDSLADTGYAIIDGFLDPDQTRWLREEAIHRFTNDRFKRAGIGHQENYQVDREIRRDFIHWVSRGNLGPEGAFFFDKLDAFTQFVNRTCFLGICEAELHFAIYPPGAFYRRHLDAFNDDDARKLSFICYLNEQDWSAADGGQLRIFLPEENNGASMLDILPVGGRMVCFRSELLEHEVLPANRERISLTGWLRNRLQLF
jgi:SM-20-related protein